MIKKWNPCPECGAEMEDIPVFLDERKLVGKIMCRCPRCYKIYGWEDRMIADDVELSPCPFCGEKATMWKVATALYAVGCFGDVLCPCNITKVAPLYYDKELAIKRWNSRIVCDNYEKEYKNG